MNIRPVATAINDPHDPEYQIVLEIFLELIESTSHAETALRYRQAQVACGMLAAKHEGLAQ